MCITFKTGRYQTLESLKKKRKLSATQRDEKNQIQDKISSKKVKELENAVYDTPIIAREIAGGSMEDSENCVQVIKKVLKILYLRPRIQNSKCWQHQQYHRGISINL